MMQPEHALTVDRLTKSYGDLTAVRELSFTVERGRIFGILGPNGSGKTTTLECVLGTRGRGGGANLEESYIALVGGIA